MSDERNAASRRTPPPELPTTPVTPKGPSREVSSDWSDSSSASSANDVRNGAERSPADIQIRLRPMGAPTTYKPAAKYSGITIAFTPPGSHIVGTQKLPAEPPPESPSPPAVPTPKRP